MCHDVTLGFTDIYSDTCLSPDSAQLSDSLRHSGKWAGDVLLDEAQTIYIKLMSLSGCHPCRVDKKPKRFLIRFRSRNKAVIVSSLSPFPDFLATLGQTPALACDHPAVTLDLFVSNPSKLADWNISDEK